MNKFIAPIFSAALLVGLYLENRTHPRLEDAELFHAVVKRKIDAIPYKLSGYEGTDRPLPKEAVVLLRPNAHFSRSYSNKSNGRSASLMVIQCADSGDMGGHYPPVCYPANGWTEQGGEERVVFTIGDTVIPMMRYEFAQQSFDHAAAMTVYDVFVLPRKGFATDMMSIRRVAANYSVRFLGAAQVQIVVDSTADRSEQEATVVDLLTPILPIIKLLESDPGTVKS